METQELTIQSRQKSEICIYTASHDSETAPDHNHSSIHTSCVQIKVMLEEEKSKMLFSFHW